LEKAKYKNVEKGNAYFTPADLIVGQDIKINSYSFHLVEADTGTKKWYADNFKA